jgi:D-alanyl-D-alanine endopeptidase (penicillin-binding protein 7)
MYLLCGVGGGVAAAALVPTAGDAGQRKSKKVATKRVHRTLSIAKHPSAMRAAIPAKPSFGQLAGLHGTPDELDLKSSVALIIDQDTREVLLRKNDSAVLPIASITKLMTGLVVSEAKLKMDEPITIAQEDVDTERNSRSRLRVGTTLTRDEALHLALMSSENRAAHALGRTYPGGLPEFVKAMNAKARELGMSKTSYADPTGLSTANQSTAHDLAVLVDHAARYPVLRQYSTTPQYLTALGNRRLQYNNSNRLVKDSRWDIELQKTGYIIEAGHCVVMRTEVAGKDLVMVLLDADSNARRNADAERLRVWLGGAPAPHKAAVAEAKPRAAAKKKDDGKDDKAVAKRGDDNKKKTEVAEAKKDKADAPAKVTHKEGRVHATLPAGKVAQAPQEKQNTKGRHNARGDDDG